MSDEEFALYLASREEDDEAGTTTDRGGSINPICFLDTSVAHSPGVPTLVDESGGHAPSAPKDDGLPVAAVVGRAVTTGPCAQSRLVQPPGRTSRSTPGPPAPTLSTDRSLATSLPAPAQRQHPRPTQPRSTGQGFDSDAQYAAALQQMEIMMAASVTATPDQEDGTIDDPVWGRFAPRNGKPLKPHTVLCISMCPCCVPPYCSADRKKAYKRVSRTAAFILALFQLALVIVSLCFRGFAPTSENPMLGPWPDTLNLLQAKNAAEVVFNFQVWRFITPIFLHAGIIHLATNLAMQLRMGLYLEIAWGTRRWLYIYFGSGILASIWSCVLKPDQLGVGASGALMGVMGAWLAELVIKWSDTSDGQQSNRMFQFVMCFINILIIIGFSFVPFIDWAAHIFGLIGGLLLGIFAFRRHINYESALKTFGLRVGAPVLFVVLFFLGVALVYSVEKPPRSLLAYCNYLQSFYPTEITRCWGP